MRDEMEGEMNDPCETCQAKAGPCRGPQYEQYAAYDCVGKIPENMEHREFACGPYARYQGYAEGQAERDVLRRALAAICRLAVKSVEYGDWPELQDAVEDGLKAISEAKR
jgi:hypothetical protein